MSIKNHHLYYQQDLRVPLTSLSIVFRGAGEQQETESYAGLSRITAKMLLRGTTTMNRETIQQQFALLGAEINASVTETDFIITTSCFSKNSEEVLFFLWKIFDEINFPENEIELVKKQELNRLEATLQDAENVLRYAKRYVLYEGSRFGKIGSRKSIQKITREEIINYFQKVLSANITYATAISNLAQGEIAKLLQPFFAQRKTNGFVLQPEIPFRKAKGVEAFIIHSPNATNDRLLWSHKGITATDERRFALSLIIDALGSFEGFLFDELRNKNGWCYGVYAFTTPATTRPGNITYYADPSDETSEHLIPALYHHLQTFSQEKSFIEKLQVRNSTFKNRYPYQLDLKYKLLSEINLDKYGIPIIDKKTYCEKIDNVRLEKANSIIQEIFDSNNITMVFYGDSERIQNILKKINPELPITLFTKEELVQ